MTSSRLQIIGGVILVVLLLVVYWVAIYGPVHSKAQKLSTQLSSLQTQVANAQQAVATGKASLSAYSKSYGNLVKLGQAVTPGADMQSLMLEIASAAKQTGIDFSSVTVGSSSTGTTSASSSSGSATSPSSGSASAPPPGSVVDSSGLNSIPLTFTFQGQFSSLVSFLGRIQSFVTVVNQNVSVTGRLLLVQAVSMAPAATGFPAITASVTASAYLLPQSNLLSPTQIQQAESNQTAAAASAGGSK